MSLLDNIISLSAPHQCIGCGREPRLICQKCAGTLPDAIPRCYRCHKIFDNWRTCPACRRKTSLFALMARTRYEGLAEQLVDRLKYERAISGADDIAFQLVQLLPNEKDLIITHLPTAPSRIRQRGYDQAKLIAKRLGGLTSQSHTTLLVRLNSNRQVGSGRQSRFANASDMFRAHPRREITGKIIVVIDDVITTGASLEAAAKILHQAGAKRVYGLVFCQA